jgi:hypothetical protein
MAANLNLMMTLAKYLLPIKKQMDKNHWPIDSRGIALRKEDWPEHYEANITLCLGIRIVWN